MNWKSALIYLRNGKKITRPNWEREHFWELSKDGFERIICHNGEHAKVYLQQLEADDWGLWREQITSEGIQKAIISFLSESGNHPNVINFSGVGKLFTGVGMSLFGMEIRTDRSLRDGEFYVSYEKPKIECFWCEEMIDEDKFIEHTNLVHPGLSPRSYDFNGRPKRC